MRRLLRILPVGLLAVLGIAGEAHADNVYLRVTGVTGEVTTKGHEGTIAVGAYTWGYGRSTASRTRPAGPRFQPLVITKRLDKTSPVLFDRFNTRTPIASLSLAVTRVDSGTGVESVIHRYCFDDATVDGSAVSYTASGTVEEVVTFRYGAVSELYPTGSVFAGWNLVSASSIGFSSCPSA